VIISKLIRFKIDNFKIDNFKIDKLKILKSYKTHLFNINTKTTHCCDLWGGREYPYIGLG